MSYTVISLLIALNVGLIYLLLAAPIGLRTVSVKRTVQAKRQKLWHALYPLGEDVSWDGKILHSRAKGSHGALLTLSWLGRDDQPITREIQLSDVKAGCAYSQIVIEDSSLEHSFWQDYSETAMLDGPDGAVDVRVAIRDRYRGLAFMIFRYFSLRRTLNRLKHWAETGEVRHGGIFEKPITQFGFAIMSALLLWPLFGLTTTGLVLAAILTGVVALHELGHMAAFRLMGHKSVRMIFIPILGGIAIGGRPYDRRFEIAFVALMGAGFSAFLVLPAIVASEWAAGSGNAALAFGAAIFAGFCAVFNLANLVPVWRFDGGQVLRQLSQDRVVMGIASFTLFGCFIAIGLLAGFRGDALIIAGVVCAVLSIVTAGRSVRPRQAMKPMSNSERGLIAAGLLAVIVIHGAGVLWAVNQLMG